MKIRIKNNSIRLRLTKTDVSNLKNIGLVSCKTVISGNEIFEYELIKKSDIQEIKAKYNQNKISIILPEEKSKILTDTDEITLQAWQENGTEDQVFLLIEKDLQCLDPTHEDQSDMYQNPNSNCG